MEITLTQAILIALWTGFALSGQLLGIYTNRSLVLSFGVGLILGDLKTALAVGAIGELAFMGFGVTPGGTIPPSPLGPGIFGTLLAVTNPNIDPTAAFSLSIPFAIAIQFAITTINTLMSFSPSLAKKALINGDDRKFGFYANLSFYLFIIVGAIIGFVAAISTSSVNELVSKIPEFITNGLSMAGAMIPAVGFAMILSNMLRKENIAFIALGYVLAAYLELPLMGVAIFAAFFAIYDYNRKKDSSDQVVDKEERMEFVDGI
ncbi:MAG: PTS mannose/fructose/sorbose/N-acetylgalactosamine transporter subunit IIC [Tissierellia bacterium]|nr:PTS mannose/fructose/sorbose/N-acetylgalactosamine transporter subunit IIC [Tissierellia bacterium]